MRVNFTALHCTLVVINSAGLKNLPFGGASLTVRFLLQQPNPGVSDTPQGLPKNGRQPEVRSKPIMVLSKGETEVFTEQQVERDTQKFEHQQADGDEF